MKARKTDQIEGGKRHVRYYDISRNPPRFMSGYSYPWPPAAGQAGDLIENDRIIADGDSRSRCVVCEKRRATTVNGVCLDCEQHKGRRPV